MDRDQATDARRGGLHGVSHGGSGRHVAGPLTSVDRSDSVNHSSKGKVKRQKKRHAYAGAFLESAKVSASSFSLADRRIAVQIGFEFTKADYRLEIISKRIPGAMVWIELDQQRHAQMVYNRATGCSRSGYVVRALQSQGA